jgi:hypothetical protein
MQPVILSWLHHAQDLPGSDYPIRFLFYKTTHTWVLGCHKRLFWQIADKDIPVLISAIRSNGDFFGTGDKQHFGKMKELDKYPFDVVTLESLLIQFFLRFKKESKRRDE